MTQQVPAARTMSDVFVTPRPPGSRAATMGSKASVHRSAIAQPPMADVRQYCR